MHSVAGEGCWRGGCPACLARAAPTLPVELWGWQILTPRLQKEAAALRTGRGTLMWSREHIS